MVELFAVLGVFAGCFWRTFSPFMRKQREAAKAGTSIKWSHHYTWTLFSALFFSFVATMMIMTITPLEELSSFPVAFCIGYTVNSIENGGIS